MHRIDVQRMRFKDTQEHYDLFCEKSSSLLTRQKSYPSQLSNCELVRNVIKSFREINIYRVYLLSFANLSNSVKALKIRNYRLGTLPSLLQRLLDSPYELLKMSGTIARDRYRTQLMRSDEHWMKNCHSKSIDMAKLFWHRSTTCCTLIVRLCHILQAFLL